MGKPEKEREAGSDFWITEFDIDGIRLDCADCLTFDFMKEMRYRTGQWKEDFWLMGEVIHGDYARWVNDEMLHSTTNYELHKGLYSGHNDHNYFEIAHTIRRQFDDNGGIYRGRTLYSFVDNHDVDRLMSKLNNKDHIREVYTLLYTLPGIPSIYYGSEWGIEGRKQGASDDAMRPQLDLEKMQKENPHPELTAHIAALGKMRKENPIPYIRSPPIRSFFSYTVTWWPRLLSMSAQARPEGPEPTIATCLSVRISGIQGCI